MMDNIKILGLGLVILSVAGLTGCSNANNENLGSGEQDAAVEREAGLYGSRSTDKGTTTSDEVDPSDETGAGQSSGGTRHGGQEGGSSPGGADY